ncbi:hypothetical protein [Erythrobacter litoralis]|nr:hypothetical protein [Erythrobacter litoralis]
MVRKAKKKPLSTAKMYQHFAVVTICVTAAIGFMADDEAQDAVKAEMAKQVADVRKPDGEPVSAIITRREGSDAQQGGGSFGPDTALGAPTLAARGSGRLSATMRRAPSKVGQGAAIWSILGMTEDEWFALSPELRRQLTGGRNVLLSGTSAERQAAMERLTQASRARTGGSSAAVDLASDAGDDF